MSTSENDASEFSAAESQADQDELFRWVNFFRVPRGSPRSAPTQVSTSRSNALTDSLISIIFVHGVAGYDYYGWKSRKSTSLSRLLMDHVEQHTDPEQCGYPDYEIPIWTVANLFQSGMPTHEILEQLAIELLRVIDLPNVENFSPIVMVAHDIGGIIAKKAVLIARDYTLFRRVAIDVDRFVFIGTPHTTSIEKWEDLLVDFSVGLRNSGQGQVFMPAFYKSLAKEFASINHQFLKFARDYKVLSIYQKEIEGFETIERIIVPQEIAVMNTINETQLARNQEHFKMCHFSKEDDQLKAIGDFTIGAIHDRMALDDYRQLYLALMAKIMPNAGSASVFAGQRPTTHTFTWIFTDGAFKSWERAQGPTLLHIKGAKGTGKTSLLRFLSQTLDRQETTKNAIIAAYFFEEGRQGGTSVNDMCRSLTGQILSISRVIFTRLYELQHDNISGEDDGVRHDVHKLHTKDPEAWYILRTILACTHQERIICVVDCANLADSDISGLLAELIKLMSIVTAPLKIILSTSGNASDIQNALDRFPSLTLDEHPFGQEDARKCIEVAIREMVERKPVLKFFQKEIFQTVGECHPLNHLDANLKIKCLENKEIQSTSQSVQEALKKIHDIDYDETLSSALENTGKIVRQWSLKVLAWMTYAFRPLHLTELAMALAMDDWHSFEGPNNEKLSRNLEADLEHALGAVVSIQNSMVHFAHPRIRSTVKTYLEINQNTTGVPVLTHRKIARICLSYLTAERMASTIDALDIWAPDEAEESSIRGVLDCETGFTLYVVQFWARHFALREVLLIEDTKHVKSFIARCWKQDYNRLLTAFGMRTLDYKNAPLAISAAFFNLPDLIGDLSKQHPDRYEYTLRKWKNDIIKEAAQGDCVAILQQLELFNGISARSRCDAWKAALNAKSWNAVAFLVDHVKFSNEDVSFVPEVLVAATSAGRIEVVSAIVDSPTLSVVDKRDIERALCIAASTNQISILKILLAHVEGMSAWPGEDFTSYAVGVAIHDAVLCGHMASIEFLLDGRQFDMYGDNAGRTTLHVASMLGFQWAVSKLCTTRNVNLKDAQGRTALHYAAVYGAVQVVQTLLDKGADINAYNVNLESPLFLAVIYRQPEMVGLLLSKGADAATTNNTQETPIIAAINARHLGIIQALVSSGTKLEATGGWDPSLLFAIDFHGGQIDIAAYLIENGADIEAKSRNGRTPLLAATENRLASIVEKLLQKGANIATSDALGRTALHIAAANGSVSTLEVLLKHEPDIDIKDSSRKTPLHHAAELGNQACAKLLLKRGAATDIADATNQRASQYATTKGRYQVALMITQATRHDLVDEGLLQQIFHNAVWAGDVNAVKTILASCRSVYDMVNSRDVSNENLSAIYNAVCGRSFDVLDYILANGADMSVIKEDVKGALQLAGSLGRIDLLQRLLDAGLDINANYQHTGTALHHTIGSDEIVAMKFLLERGADTEVFDANLKTPLQLSTWDVEVTKGLIDAGANVIADKGATTAVNAVLLEGSGLLIPDFLEVLFSHGAIVDAVDARGMTATHCAALAGHLDQVKQFLEKDSSALQRKDAQGRTALHFAATNGETGIVRFILETLKSQGIDNIDAVDDDGWTALHWSCRGGSTWTWSVLIEHGADASKDTIMGWTAYDIAEYHGNLRMLYRAIREAKETSQDDISEVASTRKDSVGAGIKIDQQRSLSEAVTRADSTDNCNQQPQLSVNTSDALTDLDADSDDEKALDMTDKEQIIGVSDQFSRRGARYGTQVQSQRRRRSHYSSSSASSESNTNFRVIDRDTELPGGSVASNSYHVCEHCRAYIYGPYFTCDTCLSYHLCFKCNWHADKQHPWHKFQMPELLKNELPSRYGKSFTPDVAKGTTDVATAGGDQKNVSVAETVGESKGENDDSSSSDEDDEAAQQEKVSRLLRNRLEKNRNDRVLSRMKRESTRRLLLKRAEQDEAREEAEGSSYLVEDTNDDEEEDDDEDDEEEDDEEEDDDDRDEGKDDDTEPTHSDVKRPLTEKLSTDRTDRPVVFAREITDI